MTSTYRVLAGFAALSVTLSVSAASLAQEPPDGPPSAAAHEHWAEHTGAHAEERGKALHELLKIRPEQEAAFQAFLASMRPEGGRMAMRDHDDENAGATLTTPQRLDRVASRMAEHQAEFQRRAAAIRSFYVTLDADQQRAFDSMPGPMGHGRHGGFEGPERHGSEGRDRLGG